MLRRHEKGQIIPLVAISLTVLMGFGGLAVDHGYWEYTLRQQQNAADSAAIGGAQALANAGCPASSAAQTAALADAASNGYGSTGITVSNPPTTGAYSGNNCAVMVSIANQKKPSFFSRVLGYNQMYESTTATAQLVANNPTCMYMLSTTGTTQFNGANITATGCGISVNGTFTCGSNTITASSIGYAGSAPSCGSAKFSAATPAPQVAQTNPCPEIAGCAYLASNPPPVTNCKTLNANMNDSISPGCYNALTVGTCGTVTLQPGLYVLNGTSDFSNTNFVGNGVTFYVTNSGTPPDFSQSGTATLTPPTTGNYKNVLYYQVPTNTKAPNFSGPMNFSGLVYAPSATGVAFDGAKGTYSVVVFGSAKLNSTTAYTFASPPPSATIVKSVVLGQ
ncbi:MAG TPA: Tad domain-containing protein [Candidatus Binatia bacterium]|nr:Tad domain-containing protein [Candidatus Binatia bacterium]